MAMQKQIRLHAERMEVAGSQHVRQVRSDGAGRSALRFAGITRFHPQMQMQRPISPIPKIFASHQMYLRMASRLLYKFVDTTITQSTREIMLAKRHEKYNSTWMRRAPGFPALGWMPKAGTLSKIRPRNDFAKGDLH